MRSIRERIISQVGERISPADLELGGEFSQYDGRGLKEARSEVKREMVLKALERQKGNLTWVASELGISRPTLYELMDKHSIKRD